MMKKNKNFFCKIFGGVKYLSYLCPTKLKNTNKMKKIIDLQPENIKDLKTSEMYELLSEIMSSEETLKAQQKQIITSTLRSIERKACQIEGYRSDKKYQHWSDDPFPIVRIDKGDYRVGESYEVRVSEVNGGNDFIINLNINSLMYSSNNVIPDLIKSELDSVRKVLEMISNKRKVYSDIKPQLRSAFMYRLSNILFSRFMKGELIQNIPFSIYLTDGWMDVREISNISTSSTGMSMSADIVTASGDEYKWKRQSVERVQSFSVFSAEWAMDRAWDELKKLFF